jgi:IclR family KDG regulon transcriptional repressor
VQSAVAKSFRLLEALSAAGGPTRLSVLASELGLQKSTVHRVLGELIELGYAERDATTGLYRPTLRSWEIGTAVVDDLPVRQAAAGSLWELHRRTGETVSLTVRTGDDVLYLDKIVSPRATRCTTRVGSRVAAPLTAGGKALLSQAEDAEEVIARVAQRPRIGALVDVDQVRRELVLARRRGYAISRRRPGVVGIAAPIVDRDSRPVAALSVSAATERCDRVARAEIVEAVLTAVAGLAESVGRLAS